MVASKKGWQRGLGEHSGSSRRGRSDWRTGNTLTFPFGALYKHFEFDWNTAGVNGRATAPEKGGGRARFDMGVVDGRTMASYEPFQAQMDVVGAVGERVRVDMSGATGERWCLKGRALDERSGGGARKGEAWAWASVRARTDTVGTHRRSVVPRKRTGRN